MADTKISALTSASALGGTEIFPGVQSAATVGVTATQIAAFVAGTANVFTTLQTFTIGAANTGVIASTGYSLTGSNATSMIDLAGTWNTSGTPTAIKLNVTNTASNAASKMIDLQVGGTTRFSVDVAGAGIFRNGILARFNGSNVVDIAGGSSLGVTVSSAATIGFSNGAPNAGTAQRTMLMEVAAGIIGVRGASTSTGGVLAFLEQTAPSAPAANGAYLYAEDNGSGKTRLMALFPSGAAQQVAIEP